MVHIKFNKLNAFFLHFLFKQDSSMLLFTNRIDYSKAFGQLVLKSMMGRLWPRGPQFAQCFAGQLPTILNFINFSLYVLNTGHHFSGSFVKLVKQFSARSDGLTASTWSGLCVFMCYKGETPKILALSHEKSGRNCWRDAAEGDPVSVVLVAQKPLNFEQTIFGGQPAPTIAAK